MGVFKGTNKVLNRITALDWQLAGSLVQHLCLEHQNEHLRQNPKEHSSELPCEHCEDHFVNIWVLKSSFFISLCGVAHLKKLD